MRNYFILTTLSDISISNKHATAQTANTLDYIPGSSILGAFAAKIYKNSNETLDETNFEQLTWNFFQNNNVIFSNCLPLKNDKNNKYTLCMPSPMAIHYKKSDAENNNREYINRCIVEQGKDQLVQQRDGYIDSTGKIYSIKKNSITRTAIDDGCDGKDKFCAKEGSLFSQSYIEKNQSFLGYIDFDDQNYSKETCNYISKKIKEFLNSEIRIGKSRNSEFGKVKLQEIKINTNNQNKIDKLTIKSRQNENTHNIFLWCVSNCEFYNLESGLPSPTPLINNILINENNLSNDNFNLEYDPLNSFIRTNTVRFFNRKRGGFDPEKILVQAGSVIALKVTEIKDETKLKECLEKISQKGIGFNRQLGLGQVIVNPLWIKKEKFKLDGTSFRFFDDINIPNESHNNNYNIIGLGQKPTIELLRWLKNKDKYNEQLIKAEKFADDSFKLIVDWYKSIRDFDVNNYGPSTSQWNEINNNLLKLNETNVNDVVQKIESITDIKTDQYGWGAHGIFKKINKVNLTKQIFSDVCFAHLKYWLTDSSVDITQRKENLLKLLEKIRANDLSNEDVYKIVDSRLNKDK